MCLGFVSSGMLRQQFGETDRLVAEFSSNEVFAAGRFVTFIEQQVERLQNAVEPPRQLVTNWDLKRDLRFLDFLLCTRQSLCNRGFGRQECMTDFRHAETAECLQRERHLRLRRNDWMTAHEHNPYSIDR